MTRITGLRGATTASEGTRTPRTAGGSRFTVSADAAPPAASAAPVGIAALLGLQDEQAPFQRDRAAKRSGERILATLAEIQAALLGCRPPDPGQLRHLIADMDTAADPALRQIIGAIRLRARVELARAERDMTIR